MENELHAQSPDLASQPAETAAPASSESPTIPQPQAATPPAASVPAREGAGAAVALAPFLFGRPLAISRQRMDALKGAFMRGRGDYETVKALMLDLFDPGDDSPPEYEIDQGTATIAIRGVLVNRADSFWAAFCGLPSYEGIARSLATALADPAVKAIVFDLDSPGGETDGLFELVDTIYAARGKKPMTAIVNRSAYSAAYAIASAADQIYVPADGGVGSIGVICEHVDFSGMEEQAGIKVTAIYAGARKNDGSPHEPLSPEAMAAAQEWIDKLYAMFVSAVARNRGVTAESVQGTQAGCFFGADGVSAGLADAIMPVADAVAKASGNPPGVSSIAALESSLAAALAELAAEKEAAAARVSDAVAAVRAEVKEIIGRCQAIRRPDFAAVLLSEGIGLEECGARLTDLVAEAQSSEIRNVLGQQAGAVSPVIAWITDGANQRR